LCASLARDHKHDETLAWIEAQAFGA
jgi:hypothetical protein